MSSNLTSTTNIEVNVEYKSVVGYEDLFKVSRCGKVISLRTGKLLRQHIRKNKRVAIATKVGGRNGTYLTVLVHRMVAETYIPNPENKPQVNHIDGVTTNNHVDNLEWCTASENVQHAYDTGLKVNAKGIDSKSSIDPVILNEILDSVGPSRLVAERLGVSHWVVNKYRKIYGK